MQGVPDHFDHAVDRAVFRRPVHADGVELYRAHIVHHRFAPHAHDGYGLGVIEAGAEQFRYAGQEHHAAAGALVLMQPGELHTGGAAGPQGWRYRMLYLDEAVLARTLADEPAADQRWHFREAVHREPARAAAMAALLARLWQDATDPGAFDDHLTRLLALLHPLAGIAPASRPDRPDPAGRFARVRERLADDLGPAPRLAELGELAGMSPFHLQRRFKACHHVTPHEWRMARLMARAQQLLARGLAPATVAQAVGLADQAHLTRRFASVYGTTPARYQRDIGAVRQRD